MLPQLGIWGRNMGFGMRQSQAQKLCEVEVVVDSLSLDFLLCHVDLGLETGLCARCWEGAGPGRRVRMDRDHSGSRVFTSFM